MTKPIPRRCKDCHAPVRKSGNLYFHADVPEWLGTVARETERIPEPRIKTIKTGNKT